MTSNNIGIYVMANIHEARRDKRLRAIDEEYGPAAARETRAIEKELEDLQ